MSQQDRLIIFDTTLRDGEQSPGASMTKDEKVRIAKALEKMRVDVIEAGFAAASPGDFDSISARSEEHTSELQSRPHLVCRLLLEKKKRCLRGFSLFLTHGGGSRPQHRLRAWGESRSVCDRWCVRGGERDVGRMLRVWVGW